MNEYYDSIDGKWTTLTTTVPSTETIKREQELSLDHIPMNVIECYLLKKN